MVLIVTIFTIWAICAGCKGLARLPKKQTKSRPTADPLPTLTAVRALQAQRESIEESLNWIDDLISTEEKPEKVLQWMTKRAQLKGQLATVEQKISKLTH